MAKSVTFIRWRRQQAHCLNLRTSPHTNQSHVCSALVGIVGIVGVDGDCAHRGKEDLTKHLAECQSLLILFGASGGIVQVNGEQSWFVEQYVQ
jgi:hypothetical protein